MAVEIRLPHGFGCAVPGEVLPGGRYLVLVWAASEAGGERTLYHGPGGAHAIAPVDADGFVRLGGEPQAVAEILASWRAS